MATKVMSRLYLQRGKGVFNMLQSRGISYQKPSRNILSLQERGIIQNVFPQTDKATMELSEMLNNQTQCIYCGFDPTADSLHVGNLLALIALLHCRRAGHQTIALLGGATAQIGDPSGKSKERETMRLETIQKNAHQIRTSLETVFINHDTYFCKQHSSKIGPSTQILDNAEWYSQRNIIEFLSTVGRYFRMGTLLSRESVKSRLKSAEGMSLTEFTYQIFQSYDWLHLYKHHDCKIQLGGNDQTGNIMSGHELISRVTNKSVFGLMVPLVTTMSGDKLGKTAGNAVWLNADKTSPFEFYQYFLRLQDAEIETYLKLFTFISTDEIKDIVRNHKFAAESRKAQKILAEQVTLLVHGESGLKSAKKCSEALFNQSVDALTQLSEAEMNDLFRNATTCTLMMEAGMSILDVVMKAGCFNREVDAIRIIKQGGVYMNHQRVQQPQYVLIPGQHVLTNQITLIRVGKKNYYLIKWVGADV